MLRQQSATAPTAAGVLVIDETGDRKAGTKSAHVGRRFLANVGKIDNGVVNVTSLWADEQLYYPLAVVPWTPKHWFPRGTADPVFRTKPQLALDLVTRAVAVQVPFRAVVADCFYGENYELRDALLEWRIPFVLAVEPSHTWWHLIDTPGALWEVASAASWQSATDPGAWVAVQRTFSDGHCQTWWALEVVAGPYGPTRAAGSRGDHGSGAAAHIDDGGHDTPAHESPACSTTCSSASRRGACQPYASEP